MSEAYKKIGKARIGASRKLNKKAIAFDGRGEVQFYTKYRFPREQEEAVGVEYYKRCELQGRSISIGASIEVPEHEDHCIAKGTAAVEVD